MWIFGYGSLLWKTNFPYEEKRNGYIRKYVRRFWQASLDHRGTLEKPGRVVTLIYTDDPNDVVWGTAFKVAPENVQSVLEYLDFREKNGYVKRKIPFHSVPPAPNPTRTSEPIESLPTGSIQLTDISADLSQGKILGNTLGLSLHREEEDVLEVEAYIADESNPHFLGPAPLESMAQQILTSFGVSGHNLEYLLNLSQVLKEIAPADHHEPHINELVKTVNLNTTTVQPQKSR